MARRLLQGLRPSGARTLVVEDDVARPEDPNLDRGLGLDHVAFVDDRVVWWADLQADAAEAARLLRMGSGGYPLNAFASSRSEGELRLRPREEIVESARQALVDSACAIFASVYDAEAYVVLLRSGAFEQPG